MISKRKLNSLCFFFFSQRFYKPVHHGFTDIFTISDFTECGSLIHSFKNFYFEI